MSRVIPEYLRKMISMLPAGLVMTPVGEGLVTFDPEEKTELAYSKMESENIDYAPLLVDGAFGGYVRREDLIGVKGKTCKEFAKEPTSTSIVFPETDLEEVLKRLADGPFLLVLANQGLNGIITRADINKRPFRVLFYAVFSEFESHLVNLIRTRLPCEKYLYLLSEDRAKDVLYNYWKAKSGNSEIYIEEYLSLRDMISIIKASKDMKIWKILQCASKKDVEELHCLVDLRNAVMHSTRSLLEREDSVNSIVQLYAKIVQLIESLIDIRS